MEKRKTVLRLVSMLTAVVLCIVGVPWSMQIVTYAESNQNRTKNFNKSYETGSTKAETMLNIAKAQIGKSGSSLGYTEDWCADFVSDCASLAGYGSAVPHNCDCDSLYNAIINAGGITVNKNEARPGDIVFYDKPGTVYGANHVEIVASGTGESLLSIGGNTGSDYVSSAVVCSPRNHPWPIIYIARPKGSGNPPPTPWTFKIENAPKCSSTRWIGEGGVTSGDDVKWVQYALNLTNNAGLEVDGVWGSKSTAATKAFQKKYGLTQDGQAKIQ